MNNRALIESFEKRPLADFTEKAYLDYSMYVILDRALPHLGDGLKPVQRRIIYAMSELGLSAGSKPKKSARTVGDVLGKYHPHGDVACYEAMVLMAQDFAYRYPLIDGQGNFGSMDDPKSFAAMRYTESKLSKYSDVLLSELGQGTVDWQPNFDGTLEEPTLLPARLPNVLLNGTMGIAVGMSTDIPPHNLREVVSACIRLLDAPETPVEALAEHVLAPDFPTGAEIITARRDIIHIYQTGNGTIRMRATYIEENGDIVITALPYQVSGAKIVEQIAAQMQAKKLPMVEDLRDESDHENPVRIVITPRSKRVEVDGLMRHLFATTQLETTVRINLNMIGTNGKPQVKDLRTILNEWLVFRMVTVRRRLQFRLDKVLNRLHILDGLLIAYLNIDEVIAIIRREDEPKPVLMKRFGLTDTQAEAILELKLRHLAKLEEIKIKAEQDKLSKERKELEAILASEKRLKSLIRDELMEDAKRFGDERRSKLVEREEAKALKEEEVLPTEPVTIILSEKGWVRAAKGHEIDPQGLSYKAGDQFLMAAKGRTNQPAVFIDSTGRTYALPAHKLPSARSQGDPLTAHLKPESGVDFVGTLMGGDEDLWLLASDAGYGFVSTFADMVTKNRAGKATLTVPKGAKVLVPKRVERFEDQYLAAVTNVGHLLIFPVAELPKLPRGKGNKIIQIPSQKAAAREEFVKDIAILNENSGLIVHCGKRSFTLSPKDLANFQGERGRRGGLLPRGIRNVDKLEIKRELL